MVCHSRCILGAAMGEKGPSRTTCLITFFKYHDHKTKARPGPSSSKIEEAESQGQGRVSVPYDAERPCLRGTLRGDCLLPPPFPSCPCPSQVQPQIIGSHMSSRPCLISYACAAPQATFVMTGSLVSHKQEVRGTSLRAFFVYM